MWRLRGDGGFALAETVAVLPDTQSLQRVFVTSDSRHVITANEHSFLCSWDLDL